MPLSARDDSAIVVCPYCGQKNEILLDRGGAERQDYEEDCQVCCRTWKIHVTFERSGAATVDVRRLED